LGLNDQTAAISENKAIATSDEQKNRCQPLVQNECGSNTRLAAIVAGEKGHLAFQRSSVNDYTADPAEDEQVERHQ
jgi:hypothetical protein